MAEAKNATDVGAHLEGQVVRDMSDETFISLANDLIQVYHRPLWRVCTDELTRDLSWLSTVLVSSIPSTMVSASKSSTIAKRLTG